MRIRELTESFRLRRQDDETLQDDEVKNELQDKPCKVPPE
jgi:hypothetical protein